MIPARIGVVVHPHRDLDEALATLRGWAAGHGEEIVQIRVEGQERQVAPLGDPADCDLIAAVGGDGTTLAALHAGAPHGLPVLGIACGSLGALTATHAGELTVALDRFAAGAWEARALPGVAVAVDGHAPKIALNDLVVVRKGANQVVVGVEIDDEPFVRFAGDGVVIATPLGSSAYTMAAGGPVLAGDTPAIVVTPVAAHGGSTPPLVVGSQKEVRVTIDGGWGGARIELDGQIHDYDPKELHVAWRAGYATLVRFAGAETLLAGLRRRRILQDSPRVVARDERERAHEPDAGAAG
ncbi:MAG TPA: NAD(+)/NADH kinase [Baekduia sp.]|uniref:NAD(+)/NADH kinase n=1 Tax=Baekduia sp. TaxID=2600305 RepID=UPI002D79B565|nr:NAD(+)/NADH kinase [Baekduia sp.]HET6507570.1 NAD(+)/NADH kinase [Baekduia sp.]